MNRISIRAAQPQDSGLILNFIKELARYQKAENKVLATIEDIRLGLFSDEAVASALICLADDKPIGYAIYFLTFSTWLGKKGLYLEDLYIDPPYRKIGAGRHLLAYLAGIAVQKGCGRLEWSVLDWNKQAIRFYETMGGQAQNGAIRYRLSGNALKSFASS